MTKLNQLLFIESYMLIIFFLSIFEIYKKNIPNKVFKFNLIIFNIFLIFQEIGIDIGLYQKLLLNFKPVDLKSVFLMKSHIELVFRVILNFLKQNDLSFYFFTFFISVINTFILYKVLHKIKYKYLYFYFYLIINIYTLNTNYLRQGLALHLFLYAIYLNITESKKIKSKIYYLFSILSHKTVMLISPIFYFERFLKKKISIINIIIFFLLGFFSYKIIFQIVFLYSGEQVLLKYMKNYFLYFRKGMEYPTILHEILFKMSISFIFIINLIVTYVIKNRAYENKLSDFLYKMMILGNYFLSFFLGMGLYSFGIYEIGIRGGYCFFLGNFLVIGDYIINQKNKLKYILIFAVIIRIFSLFVLLQTNRQIAIIPNLFK